MSRQTSLETGSHHKAQEAPVSIFERLEEEARKLAGELERAHHKRFYLNAMSNVACGMGRALDWAGELGPYCSGRKPEWNDVEALRKDWLATGNYLWQALQSYDQLLSEHEEDWSNDDNLRLRASSEAEGEAEQLKLDLKR